MDIDIVTELKMLNGFVDPRPRMTIERAIYEIEQLRHDNAEIIKNCFTISEVNRSHELAIQELLKLKD